MLLQRFIVPVDKTRRDKAHTISGGASIIVDICSNWKGMMILQRCVNTATLRVRRKHATVPLCGLSKMGQGRPGEKNDLSDTQDCKKHDGTDKHS